MSQYKIMQATISFKRFLIVVGAFSGVISLISFFSDPFNMYMEKMYNIDLTATAIPIASLLVTVLSFSFVYLQSGRGGGESGKNDELLSTLLSELESQKYRSKMQIDELYQTIESLKVGANLTPDERSFVLNSVIEGASQDTIEEIFEGKTKNLKDEIAASISIDRLKSSSNDIVHRLRREISDLRLRSNINLLIGMAITGGGLYLLWSTVAMVDASELLKQLASEGQDSNVKFFKNLVLPIIPRISLVVFVEIFAYFFLRLYKAGLSEIKYFQNELTNIESKLTAVEFSYMTKNQDGLKSAIEALSKTERNFVLEKGQTTVELERAKSDSELTKNIIDSIPKLFARSNK
ncbi:hypothetical protein [Pseudomonas putida]|uniref:hypothetical protein n=1 Tax=Pseudomonas putida TaxID=303 RepID=UPI003D9839DE